MKYLVRRVYTVTTNPVEVEADSPELAAMIANPDEVELCWPCSQVAESLDEQNPDVEEVVP